MFCLKKMLFIGSFIQFAADNNDIHEETLDGKNTTHATTLVVYQKKPLGPMPPPEVHADHADKRRSLQTAYFDCLFQTSIGQTRAVCLAPDSQPV